MTALVQLRDLLNQRFPRAGLWTAHSSPQVELRQTGMPALDRLLGGGLPRGKLTEVVASEPGSGSAQFLHEMIRATAAGKDFMALIDGADSFDAGAMDAEVLARLLWVRCVKVSEALAATDLLLRDRNFPFVVLDLKMNSVSQLRRIPANVWPRLGRLIEQHDATLLVMTPFQCVTGAACRVGVDSHLDLAALAQESREILGTLFFEVTKSVKAGNTVVTAKAG
jgi:ActR/RegA family two-component response regulator